VKDDKMKKAFKRQVIRGIIGLIISIGIFIAFVNLFDLSTDRYKFVRYLFILGITPTFFGFLLYIFGGKKSFIWGLKLGLTFVVFTIAMYELPKAFSGVLIVILAVVFLAWPKIKEYLNDNRQPTAKDIMKMEEQIEIKNQEALDEKEFQDSLGYREKSLLLCSPMGTIYQVVSGEDKYYFIMVGGQFSGIDDDLLITDFSNESRYLSNKKDYAINKKDITAVSINQKHLSNFPLPNSGELSISLETRKKKYAILDLVDVSSVNNFFGGIANIKSVKALSAECEKEPELSKDESMVLLRLKKICLVLNVLAIVAPAIFLFIDFNYQLMSSICLLIPLIILGMYFKYNNILSFEDEKSTTKKRKNKIMMELPLILPGFAMGMRSILDFNLVGLKALIFWSISICCLIMIAFFLFTKEYKIKKSVILVIVLFMLFYVPSAVVQVNYLFDHSEPIIYTTQIIDMYIDTGSKAPDQYLLTVSLQSGKQMDMNVSKSFYGKEKKGQQVQISERIGFLKIKYAQVDGYIVYN
jgi:hypothetical protein